MSAQVHEAVPDASNIITTQVIKRICVERGFYRNPICNETLYLHHKGFDGIDLGAFDPYVNVKVLWLEGNALDGIACGKDSVVDTRKFDADRNATDAKNLHIDSAMKWMTEFSPAGSAGNESAKKEAQSSQEQPKSTAPSNEKEEGTTGVIRRDVFRTFYPTMRQLYLQNNVLREMPDLSGFQRLDSVNLSGNLIHTVRAHCAAFRERVVNYAGDLQTKAKALLTNSKNLQPKESDRSTSASSHGQVQTDLPQPPPMSVPLRDDKSNPAPKDKADTKGCCDKGGNCGALNTGMDGKGNSEEKELTLTEWTERVGYLVGFCPHEAIEASETGKLCDNVPPSRLNPCSSIRTLNLASNFLTEVGDLVELLCYKFLATLDLSYNRLHDGPGVLLVLERLPHLRLLKLSGNPLVRTLPRYRKTVLGRCGGLLHLDDRPVFVEERRLVTAWLRGGEEEENRERQCIKDEKEREHARRLEEFRALVNQSSGQRSSGTAPTRFPPAQRGVLLMNGGGLNTGNEESTTSSEEESASERSGGSENNGMSNVNNREEEDEEGEISGEAEKKDEPATRVIHTSDSDKDDDVYVPSM